MIYNNYMKKTTLLALVLSVVFYSAQTQEWKIVSSKITTPWAEELNASAPLPE